MEVGVGVDEGKEEAEATRCEGAYEQECLRASALDASVLFATYGLSRD